MSREVPEGWDFTAIGSQGRIVTGKTPPTGNGNLWDGEIPFVTPSDLGEALYADETARTITKEGLSYCKTIPKWSILVTCIASIGKMAISTRACVTNQQINAVVPNDPADAIFLYYALQHRLPDLQNLAGKTAVPIVNKSLFSSFAIPLPPTSERRRIAEILSSVDEAIAATRAVIEQTRKVKQAVLERLLTKGIGHTRFKQTEIGEIPEEWESSRIGDIANVKGGKRMPAGRPFATERTPYPYIRVSDFRNGSIDRSELVYVWPNDQLAISRYTISCRDVYISIAGTIGVSGMVPGDLDGAQLTENAAKISALDDSVMLPEFLSILISSEAVQTQISAAKGVGGGVPKLALFRIAEMKIPLPPRKEQEDIIQRISSLNDGLASNEGLLDMQQRTKSALMSDLLTGRKRVTNTLPLAAE